MYRTIFRFALLLSAAIPFASFAAETRLSINDPYVNLVPPNSQVSAAFMVIKNAGSTDRKLVKAESPVAKTVELHSHTNENGVMKMREVKSIDIKANGQAELKPGGYHIMLINIRQALKEGDAIPIALSFDDGSKQQIEAPVRKVPTTPSAEKGMDHSGMKHKGPK